VKADGFGKADQRQAKGAGQQEQQLFRLSAGHWRA